MDNRNRELKGHPILLIREADPLDQIIPMEKRIIIELLKNHTEPVKFELGKNGEN